MQKVFLAKDCNPYAIVNHKALRSENTKIIFNRGALMDDFVALYMDDHKLFGVEYLKSYNVVFKQFLEKKGNGFDLFLRGIVTRLRRLFNKNLSTFIKFLVHAFWEQNFDKLNFDVSFKAILQKIPIDFSILSYVFEQQLSYGEERKFESIFFSSNKILLNKLAAFSLEDGPMVNLSKNTHFFLKLFL